MPTAAARVSLCALALAASLAAVPAASAKIVPGVSIAGVAIGDTRADADRVLGKSTNKQTGEAGYSVDYATGRMTVNFVIKTGIVFGMTTESTSQRTADGIGPGVSADLAKRRLTGERCNTIYFDGVLRGECTTHRKSGVETDYLYSLKTRKLVAVSMVDYG